MFIIDDLLITLPAKGLWALFKKIHELAEEELNNEPKLKAELLRFQTMLDLNQITEEEYQKREDEIIARLNEIRERKREESLS